MSKAQQIVDFIVKNPSKKVLVVSRIGKFMDLYTEIVKEISKTDIQFARTWMSVQAMNFSMQGKDPCIYLVNMTAPIPDIKVDLIFYAYITEEKYIKKFHKCATDDAAWENW